MNLLTRLPLTMLRSALGLLRRRRPGSRSRFAVVNRWLVRALVVVALAVLVIGLAISWSFIEKGERQKELERLMAESVAKLDAGDYESARRIAGQLRESELGFQEMGGPVFVLGAALVHDAKEHSDPYEQKNLYLIASRYLEEARDRSFPPGKEAAGILLMAEAMFRSGRYAECIPVLLETLKIHPTQRTLIHRYLAEAYELDLSRQYDKSLVHIGEFLNDKMLSTVDRLEGQVLQARVALRRARQITNDPQLRQHFLGVCQAALAETKKIAEARRQPAAGDGSATSDPKIVRKEDRLVEARINELLNESAVLEAQMLLHEVFVQSHADTHEPPSDSRQLLEQARDRLRSLAEQGRNTPAADYLLGHVLRELSDLNAALQQLGLAARRNYGSPEGFAAELEKAEVERLLKDHPTSVETYKSVLKDVGDPAQFSNPWIDELDGTDNGDELDELRRRILTAYTQAIDEQRFDHGASLTEHFEPLFAADYALQLKAETQAAWADHLERQAATASPTQARAAREEALSRFRNAGSSFRDLAALRFATREYTDILWSSADNFLRGNDYHSAAAMVEEYLTQEPRRRRPRALTMLGDAQLGQNDLKAAAETYRQCLAAYPKDPDAYRARLGAAQTAFELGNLDETVQLLRENLENAALTPQSVDWRDSLFLLGETLYRQGLEKLTRSRESTDATELDEQARKLVQRELDDAAKLLADAALRFEEAVQRYPEDPRTTKAQYLLAEAHRQQSKIPRWKLPLETIETRRVELSRKIRSELETAHTKYKELMRQLDQKQETWELTPLELAIQRNCYFASAHTLFDLEKYEEAVEAYSTATNRYQSEPASLEAYQQIAACYRKLGEPAKARGTLEQAKMVIANMPTNVDYQKTTRFPRNVWLELLK